MDVDDSLSATAGALFLAAAAVIAAIALRPVPAQKLVTGLTALNLIGGIAIWCVLPIVWSDISPEGRWMTSAGRQFIHRGGCP